MWLSSACRRPVSSPQRRLESGWSGKMPACAGMTVGRFGRSCIFLHSSPVRHPSAGWGLVGSAHEMPAFAGMTGLGGRFSAEKGKGRIDARPEEQSIRPFESVWGTLIGNAIRDAPRVPDCADVGFPALVVVKGILTKAGFVKNPDIFPPLATCVTPAQAGVSLVGCTRCQPALA